MKRRAGGGARFHMVYPVGPPPRPAGPPDRISGGAPRGRPYFRTQATPSAPRETACPAASKETGR
jgi:hypothetical protein